MNKIIGKLIWTLFAFLCICIGLYPALYFFVDRHFGLLSTKSQEVLTDQLWNIGFYGHIVLGGLALLIGWTQFSHYIRTNKIELHRTIGKVYILSVLISGPCGIFVAQFATGGITNVIGFSLSGILWIACTILAYTSIRKGQIASHYRFMMYSYSLCFSAVTLRFWLAILTAILGGFNEAYLIVGWLSWIPNLIVAYFLIQRGQKKLKLS